MATTFDYTTGNPNNLAGGQTASMGDIQGPFTDLKTFINDFIIEQLEAIQTHVGEIRHMALAAAPTFWLPADGAAVSRTTYSLLFAAIGTVYGVGDGTNTFNVPDLAGRTAVGSGTGSGLTARTAGTKFGAEALVTANLPPHSHTLTVQQNATNFGGSNPAMSNGTGTVTSVSATGGGGSSTAHWQPSLAIPAYIYAGA